MWLLRAPTYGTKDQLWARLQQYEGYAKKKQGLKMQLAEELEARRAAREGTERAAIPLPVPLPPTEAEVAAHEATHFRRKLGVCIASKANGDRLVIAASSRTTRRKAAALCRWTTCS